MAEKTTAPSPSIYWRLGNKALPENGGTWGTMDPEIAEIQFARRLTELQENRRGRAGVAQEKTITLGKLGTLHLTL